tara:strand:+ start:38 stop:397 length:360 start_codon:yes stop_codon:yes gene_type:complete
MKRIWGSIIHVLIAILAIILATSKANGQVVPEMVPYMLQPIDYDPDERLELGIALMQPYQIDSMEYNIQKRETLEVIYERINFELINPDQASNIFIIDDKPYVLVRLPYTGTPWNDRSY